MSSNPCIYMDYVGGDHLNARKGLYGSTRQSP